MAAQMKADGMEELSEMLEALGDAAPGIAARALYDGAGIMMDAINAGAAGIRTAPFKWAGENETRLPSPEEKEIVQRASAGIAKFNKEGTEVDTSVGYQNAGYAKLKGKTVPVPKVVNAINSGTSFMTKQPFVRKAARDASPRAMEAMKQRIEAELEDIGMEYRTK